MMQILIWIFTVPAVLIGITFIPFPEIPPEVLTSLDPFFGYIWFLEKYFPIGTLMQYVGYIVLIEVAVLAMEIFDDLRSGATGAKPIFGFITGKKE